MPTIGMMILELRLNKILLATSASAHILHHCLSWQTSITGQQVPGLYIQCQLLWIVLTNSDCMQKQEETCSHYRKWLSAVAECAKALTDSKAQVVKAEADVKVRLHAVPRFSASINPYFWFWYGM